LATVKRIIGEYNGSIQVDSRLGEGSTFTVILPRA
jgi:signal transduction histidine kinase